jgi:hypothetical protein
MKMTYIIIALVLIGGLAFYLKSSAGKTSSADLEATSRTDSVKTHQTKQNMFEDLRSMAFKTTADQLGLAIPANQTIVYGVVMDWEMGGATATTVAYQTGDASLYLSSGAGVIGGGQHENVNRSAKEFVHLAQTYLYKTNKTETTSLPKEDFVKFYLLTTQGVYVGEEAIKNFENNTSHWLLLFEEGNKVLTELRKTSEK